jgi:hypothetical protein
MISRPNQEKLWSLCEQAAKESDPAKVTKLAARINRLLSQEQGLEILMAHPNQRVPRIGDHVTVTGHIGEFLVSGVNFKAESVELRQIGQDFALSTIGWHSLTFA